VSPLEAEYHDREWGVPCHGDRELFERLMLEGFQAGLSWETILKRRQGFFEAFEGWDPVRIAAYGPDDLLRLMEDPRIIRNRLKVECSRKNAIAFLKMQREFGTFDAYIWEFSGGSPLRKPAPRNFSDVPAATPESDAMSKALKKQGFGFVGPTICYAFMQSVGMVNDHLEGCPVRGAAG
jgi:DNA-3-methyladenine glycosylase I